VNFRTKSDDDDSTDSGVVSFNSRATAAVIDGVIATGIAILLAYFVPFFPDKLAWLVALAYIVARDSLPFLGGQSVGKKAMKIQVVTLEGKSLVGDWQTAAIRNGPLIIPLFAFVELYILLNREEKPERGRRLGDEWAKTKVIVERKPVVEDEIG
jgi:uncharacterized RDD family membrane protein YckC